MGIFKFFTENSFMHVIAFNPRTQKTLFLPFSLRCVHYCTLALICELHGSNSNVSTHFSWSMLKQYHRNNQRISSALPREVLYVPQRDIPSWIW